MFVTFNFTNLPTVQTLLNCCGKAFILGIDGQSGRPKWPIKVIMAKMTKLSPLVTLAKTAKKSYQMSTEKLTYSQLPSWRLTFFLGIFGQGCQRLNFGCFLDLLAKVTNSEGFGHFGHVSFIGNFGCDYQWWKACDKEFVLLSNLWHPAPPNATSRSLEATSGTPLGEQEFVLREATFGMGLKVQTYSCIDRQLVARKYEYIRTTVGKVF